MDSDEARSENGLIKNSKIMCRRTIIIIIMGACLLRFVEAITPNLHYGKVFYNFAQRSEEKGNSRQALGFYQKAFGSDPSLMEAYFSAGRICLNTKEYDKAIEYLWKAIYLNPETHEMYNYLGLAYQGKGYYSEACQSFEKAIGWWIKLRGGHPALQYWYNKGETHLMAGEREKALEELHEMELFRNHSSEGGEARALAYKLRHLLLEGK